MKYWLARMVIFCFYCFFANYILLLAKMNCLLYRYCFNIFAFLINILCTITQTSVTYEAVKLYQDDLETENLHLESLMSLCGVYIRFIFISFLLLFFLLIVYGTSLLISGFHSHTCMHTFPFWIYLILFKCSNYVNGYVIKHDNIFWSCTYNLFYIQSVQLSEQMF